MAGPSQLTDTPADLAADRHGRVLVLDGRAAKVRVFEKNSGKQGREEMSHEESPITRRRMMCDATRYVALGGIGSLSAWLFYKQIGPGGRRLPESRRHVRRVQPGGRLPPAAGLADRSQPLHRLRPLPDELRARPVGRQGGELLRLVRLLRQLHGLLSHEGRRAGHRAPRTSSAPPGPSPASTSKSKSGVRYFEYTIDEGLCIACGKCVVGCRLMNGSLFLQVRHDRCLNCNECSIAVACPDGGLSPRAGRFAAVAESRGPGGGRGAGKANDESHGRETASDAMQSSADCMQARRGAA